MAGWLLVMVMALVVVASNCYSLFVIILVAVITLRFLSEEGVFGSLSLLFFTLPLLLAGGFVYVPGGFVCPRRHEGAENPPT